MAEAWSQDLFEEHWYAWAPKGSVGRPVPCQCGEEYCHGWRMIPLHIPAPALLVPDHAVLVVDIDLTKGVPLKPGDMITVTTSATM